MKKNRFEEIFHIDDYWYKRHWAHRVDHTMKIKNIAYQDDHHDTQGAKRWGQSIILQLFTALYNISILIEHVKSATFWLTYPIDDIET